MFRAVPRASGDAAALMTIEVQAIRPVHHVEHPPPTPMRDTHQVQLTSTDGAVFELRPSGYEYPALTTPGEPDANWLIVHGTVLTAAGDSWAFFGPDLTTWEAEELLGWLHAAAEGRLEPSDDPGSDMVTSTLMFIEPNLAFSVAAVEGEHTTLRVHLSLEAAAGRPGGTAQPRPRIYEYSIPFRIDRDQLLTAAEQWSTDIAPFPAR